MCSGTKCGAVMGFGAVATDVEVGHACNWPRDQSSRERASSVGAIALAKPLHDQPRSRKLETSSPSSLRAVEIAEAFDSHRVACSHWLRTTGRSRNSPESLLDPRSFPCRCGTANLEPQP